MSGPGPREKSLEELMIPEPNSGCWLWVGAMKPCGYGYVNRQGKDQLAHRLSYTQCVGPIPRGLGLDHLCRVLLCINPAHLEAVPHRINVLRGIGPTAVNARKERCPQGHPYVVLGGRRYQRCCPICRAVYRTQWRAARRAEGKRVV